MEKWMDIYTEFRKTLTKERAKFDIKHIRMKQTLDIPGVRIDRALFLKQELMPYADYETLDKAVKTTPQHAGVKEADIEHIVNQRIKFYAYHMSAVSGASGLPMGLSAFVLGGVDMMYFYMNACKLAQEILYLSGYPDVREAMKHEEQMELMMWMVFGSSASISLCKDGICAAVKKLMKKTYLVKLIPLGGGILSALITYRCAVSLGDEFYHQLKVMKKEIRHDHMDQYEILEDVIDIEFKEKEEKLKQFCNLEKLKELRTYLQEGYISQHQFAEMKAELQ